MASTTPAQQRRVVTLEQLIVDTFTRIDDAGVEKPVEQPDQIGGGGTYTVIGSRMFLPPSRVGMIADYTPESLPEDMKTTLKAFGSEMWAFRERTDGHPTARAVNRYRGEVRGFDYLTEPSIITPKGLKGTAFNDPLPSTIHFISYPAPRAKEVLSEVAELKKSRDWSPLVVWEPQDEDLETWMTFGAEVDIIGPNHDEALRLYSLITGPEFTDDDIKATLTKICRQFAYMRPRVGAIIRAGHMGCCYAAADPKGYRPDVKWLPAYWSKEREGSAEKVVDPTGAGNAFMGGVAAALDEGKTLEEAVKWGSVAASFTIEQNGLPTLTKGEDGKELWNGEDPWERVKAMGA